MKKLIKILAKASKPVNVVIVIAGIFALVMVVTAIINSNLAMKDTTALIVFFVIVFGLSGFWIYNLNKASKAVLDSKGCSL